MKIAEELWIDRLPTELWRLGTVASPRLDRLRIPPRPAGAPIDVVTFDRRGTTWVRARSGGISTFDGPNPRLSGGAWWRLPRDTPIPEGLIVSKNHRDAITGLTHFRIEPAYDMTLTHFVVLLRSLALHAHRQSQQSTIDTGV